MKINRVKKKKLKEKRKETRTFFYGLNLSAGAASGVDGFLVFLRSGVRCLLPDNHGLPVLRDVSNS